MPRNEFVGASECLPSQPCSPTLISMWGHLCSSQASNRDGAQLRQPIHCLLQGVCWEPRIQPGPCLWVAALAAITCYSPRSALAGSWHEKPETGTEPRTCHRNHVLRLLRLLILYSLKGIWGGRRGNLWAATVLVSLRLELGALDTQICPSMSWLRAIAYLMAPFLYSSSCPVFSSAASGLVGLQLLSDLLSDSWGWKSLYSPGLS